MFLRSALLLSLSLALAPHASVAQSRVTDEIPLNWKVGLAGSASNTINTAEIVFDVSIPTGWIVYSSDFVNPLGPHRMQVRWQKEDDVELLGGLRAIEPRAHSGESAAANYSYFEHHAQLRQRIQIRARPVTLRGSIDGQVCEQARGLCQLFHQPFTLTVPATAQNISQGSSQ
jgi:DsbC/DsbD-like thiol-disulfide interchange protein